MPKKGWEIPQIRFCSAIANAKVSRLQPWSRVIGCRNRPKPCRVPMASVRMVPPQISTTAGVRQVFIGVPAKGGIIAHTVRIPGPHDAHAARSSELLRTSDDQPLSEVHLDQAQVLEHFLALDKLGDGLDAHVVEPAVDRLGALGGGERAADVLHDS